MKQIRIGRTILGVHEFVGHICYAFCLRCGLPEDDEMHGKETESLSARFVFQLSTKEDQG